MTDTPVQTGGPGDAGNVRQLTGFPAKLSTALCGLLTVTACLYIFRAYSLFGLIIYKEQYLAFFLTLCIFLTFVLVPASRRSAAGKVPWYDWLLASAALLAGGYVTVNYEEIINTIGYITTDKLLCSTVSVVLLLEATRRHMGWLIVMIGLVGLGYAYFGHLLPGALEMRPIRFDRLMIYSYLNHGSIVGIPLYVAATIVLSFMFFGRMLFAIGGGEAISDIAFAAMGRYRGGPAKVGVVASALFGSLSGSASGNVATTGMVTIPLMRRIGYTAPMAAAVEATASTGGLILPPVMAATGFIIAEFLGITYAEVAVAATLPALLYYFSIFIQVDLAAAKSGMRGLPPSQLPNMGEVSRRAWPILFPVVVLLYSLFVLYHSAEASGMYAAAAAFAISLVFPAFRRNWRRYLGVVVDTGRDVVYIVIICALAGLIMGILGITGLGLSLSTQLIALSGGSVWLLLILTALGAIVLGMGVPVTATYIILIVLVGPALTKMDIDPLAAHLFVFYFGTLSFLTPPVCISVFVAAAIANAKVGPTALHSLRLAAVAYIMPFLFVFNDHYMLRGDLTDIVLVVVGGVSGVFLLSIALVGHFVTHLLFFERMLAFGLALTIFIYGTGAWYLLVPLISAGMLMVLLHWHRSLRLTALG